MSIPPNVSVARCPRLSVHERVTVCPAPSVETVTGAIAAEGGRFASAWQTKVTVTSLFVQVPLTYGLPAAVALAVSVGGAATTKLALAEVELPARSVAVQLTLCVPAVDVLGVPQATVAMPEPASLACASTTTVPPSATSAGATVG